MFRIIFLRINYFEDIVDTNDEWILSRTGIKERRILNKGTSHLAEQQNLLEKTNTDPTGNRAHYCSYYYTGFYISINC